MQRITTLLQKINELASKDKDAGVIDIDLMMDYTRVLYADLVDWRSRVLFNSSLVETNGSTVPPPTQAPVPEPAPIPTPAPPPVPEPVPSQPEVPEEEPQLPGEAGETVTEAPAAPAATPHADIRKWIGINDKYQFISELFGNDKESYEDVLSELNQHNNYDTAVAYLDEIQNERAWNNDDITIQSFYGIVSQFFSER